MITTKRLLLPNVKRLPVNGENRTDAIRFALDRATPEGAEPLVLRVVKQTTAVLQHGGKERDDYSVVVSVLTSPYKNISLASAIQYL